MSFVSLGCPKALVDSERIVTRLRAEGYELARSHAGRRPRGGEYLRLSRQRAGGIARRHRQGAQRERQGHRDRLHGRRAREDHRATRRSSPSPVRSSTKVWSRPCIARCRRAITPFSTWCRPRVSSSRRGTTPISRFPRAATIAAASASSQSCAANWLAPRRRGAARGRAARRRRRKGAAGHLAGHLRLRQRPQICGERWNGRDVRAQFLDLAARSASWASGCGCTTSIPIRMSTRSCR